MRKSVSGSYIALTLLAATLFAQPAAAEPDSFWLGTGRDGALTVGDGETRVVNRYAQVVAPLAPGNTVIDVGATTGFAAGDLILVHQTTGLVPAPSSGAATSIDLSSSPVGRWELARLSTVSGSQLVLTAPLYYSYAALVSQVVRVPEYTTVSVAAQGLISAEPWNGSMGGIVAFLAQGSLTNNGRVSAQGAGFRGGEYVPDPSGAKGCTGLEEPAPQGAQRGEGLGSSLFGPVYTGRGNLANAGGGGVCFKAGGAGGSNRARGGKGGLSHATLDGSRDVGGLPGVQVIFNPLERLIFGGGGGSGHGSNPGGAGQSGARGGGAILIRAQDLQGTGIITVDGNDVTYSPTEDASGGGGAGGSVLVRFVGAATCNTVRAYGGRGGATDGNQGRAGPGGGGGGGYARLQSAAEGTACNVYAPGGLYGYCIVNNTFTLYGAGQGGLGLAEKISSGLINPAVPQVSSPAQGQATNSRRPQVTATYSGAGSASVGLFVDGLPAGIIPCDSAGACSGPVLPELAEGAHQLKVASIVDGLWSSQSAAITFYVDLTAPQPPVITAPTSGALFNTTRPPFRGTAEAGGTVTVFVDGVNQGSGLVDASGSWSVTPSSISHGAHSVRASVRDPAGNSSALSSAVSFVIDTVSPSAPTVLSPANDSVTSDATPVISGWAEEGATVTVVIDGSPIGTTVSSETRDWSLTVQQPLVDGPHTVTATARDVAGNVSAASETITFTVDTVPPTVSITSGPPALTSSRSSTWTFASSDSDVIYFECSLDGEAFAGCSSPYTILSVSHGPHELRVRARDRAFNVSPVPARYTWVVDVEPPLAPVFLFPLSNGVISTAQPIFSGTAEANSAVTVFVDGSEIGSVSADAEGAWALASTAVLSDGSHTVSARARDVAGNNGPAAGPMPFTVDTVAPDTTLVSAPSGVVTNANASFTFSSSDAEASFECSLDGAAFTACTSPLELQGIVDGTHTFQVRARDAAGNVDATPASASWVSDTGAPSVSIASGPANPTRERDGTFTLSSNELGATFECSLDGGAFQACTTPVTFPGLVEGAHTLEVRATDAVGNSSATSARWTWTVDTTAPRTAFTQRPEAETQESSATFAFSSEAGATFECRVDSGAFQACTSPVTLTGLSEGRHTFEVRAKDAAGNVEEPALRHEWTLRPPGGGETPSGGCGCAAQPGGSPAGIAALALLAMVAARRRRA